MAGMTLHSRQSIGPSLDDSIYARKGLAKAAPKYRFPPEEWRAEDAFAVVADELMLDGNARQNLATFCQTWEEPEVHQLMELADRLRVRGWQVPAYPLSGAVADVAVQRILVRQGVSRDLATLLLRDLREAVDQFTDHPVAVPMSSAEASGFSQL
jgi:glutamate/tyrosine decarboxylase-like PLP-dependent enzyme